MGLDLSKKMFDLEPAAEMRNNNGEHGPSSNWSMMVHRGVLHPALRLYEKCSGSTLWGKWWLIWGRRWLKAAFSIQSQHDRFLAGTPSKKGECVRPRTNEKCTNHTYKVDTFALLRLFLASKRICVFCLHSSTKYFKVTIMVTSHILVTSSWEGQAAVHLPVPRPKFQGVHRRYLTPAVHVGRRLVTPHPCGLGIVTIRAKMEMKQGKHDPCIV